MSLSEMLDVTINILILMYILYILLFHSQKRNVLVPVDRTLEESASGVAVVEATLDKIRDSRIFPDDKLFLRRAAFVESKYQSDGNHSGGIWKIDEESFKKMHEHAVSNPRPDGQFSKALPKVKSIFGIQWKDVEYAALQKPLYSCLAARLKLSFLNEPIPRSVEDQAKYWKTIYTNNSNESAEKFLEDIQQLEEEEEEVAANMRADIIFCLDGSSSIGHSNFRLVLQFVQKVITGLSISLEKVRIGVIQFADYSKLEFGLNSYLERDEVINAVGKIKYSDDVTNTPSALNKMIEVFREQGRRNEGILRLGVVLTDGFSNDFSETIRAAREVHLEGISMLAIGVGDDINKTELNAIASCPENVNYLASFSNLRYFERQFADQARKSISVLQDVPSEKGKSFIVNGSTNSQSPAYYKTEIPNIGATVSIRVSSSNLVSGYISYTRKKPNSAIYDFAVLSTSSGLWIPPQKPNPGDGQSSTIYISIVGQDVDTDFQIILTAGD